LLLRLIQQLWPHCVTFVMKGLNTLWKCYCNGLWIYEIQRMSLQVQKCLMIWNVQLVCTLSQSLLNIAVLGQRASVWFYIKSMPYRSCIKTLEYDQLVHLEVNGMLVPSNILHDLLVTDSPLD
jgi:hypothetical protein